MSVYVFVYVYCICLVLYYLEHRFIVIQSISSGLYDLYLVLLDFEINE
jgi:hypothetical protein